MESISNAAGAAAFDREAACKALVDAKTPKDLKQALYLLSMKQNDLLLKDPKPANRHEVGTRLNDCSPEKDSKSLVISFAGTGAYNPRAEHLSTFALGCLGNGKKLNSSLVDNYYSEVKNALHDKGKHVDQWSAILTGIIPRFLDDPKLSKDADKFDFASFPSEESEVIAEPGTNWSVDKVLSIKDEVSRSVNGTPRGISNAKACLDKYMKKAKELGIKPKVVVLSHSSGGRSAVKFHELVKNSGHKTDLVFSIDPVIEAHHAIGELAEQIPGYLAAKANPFKKEEPHIPTVYPRDHGAKLYKPTNADKWYSVHQNMDTKGLGFGPIPQGICGSVIKGADYNLYINDFQKDGSGVIPAHGGIGYHQKTKDLFLQQMHNEFYP